MKTRILSILAAMAAFLTLLGGLDLSGIVSILPNDVATGFATALPLLAGIVHVIKAIGDFADDGEINGSFHCHALVVILALGIALMSMSCVPGAVWTVRTPYGDAHRDGDGAVTLVPRVPAIVIPGK